ncbi:MAG: hypothetical protein ACFFE3_13015 [Candidatus Thorarchaeota archaeon]
MESPIIRFYGEPNPGGIWDIALDEAILCNTCQNHGPLTFRMWQSTNPVLVLPRSTLSNEETLIRRCRRKNVNVTRSLRGRRPLLYGPGILSISIIDKSEALISGDLEKEIAELLIPIFQGIQTEVSPYEATITQDFILVNNSVIGSYNAHYYFDYTLLQGMIVVNKNEQLLEIVNSEDKIKLSSLDIFENDIRISSLIDSVVQSVSQHFNRQISVLSASTQETELMTKLYQWKYATDDWIFHHSAPLALGRVLLEAYLAYPPTARCREIMAIIDVLSEKHGEKVEVRTWFRGRGLVSWFRGIPPGLPPSGGVVQASKKNIVPAIVVQGKITHKRTVPTYDDLYKVVEEAYSSTFGGTLK